jgi:hypothetical protein
MTVVLSSGSGVSFQRDAAACYRAVMKQLTPLLVDKLFSISGSITSFL